MPSQTNPAHGKLNPDRWVELYADVMFRYTVFRLRDESSAEDVVQETFIAAFKAREKFSGNSSEKTWLMGILKHKLIDHFRQSKKVSTVADLENDEGESSCFDEKGMWKTQPKEWSQDPAKSIEKKEFWAYFESCRDGLPENLHQIFMLKEIEGMKGKEICNITGVTSTNLWVMLHRARLKIRNCMEGWFGREVEL